MFKKKIKAQAPLDLQKRYDKLDNFEYLWDLNVREISILDACVRNAKKHLMHPLVSVDIKDGVTNETTTLLLTITTKKVPIKKHPTLTETYFNTTIESSMVFEIADDLNVTINSWVVGLDLSRAKSQKL